MMIKPELVRKIKEYFDLNIYETKVWLALLSKGVVTAGESAELSGVPRSRTYDVLESLEKRGFAIIKIGKPVKYIAVDPKTVIEKMKSVVMNEAQDKVKSLGNLRGTAEYAELEQVYKSGLTPIKSEDLSGFMKGRSNIVPKLRELFDKAEKEIAIYTSASDFESKSRVLAPMIENAQKKDMKLKLCLSGEFEQLKKIENKYNIKVRAVEQKGRFFIADKKEVLFMISPENAEEEVAIWLNAPSFTESLHGMAETQIRR